MYGDKKTRICNLIVRLQQLITDIQFLITFFEEFAEINPVSLTTVCKTIQCIILRPTIINTNISCISL